MGQIVGLKAKPKRCNLNKLSKLGIPDAGEYILVSYDNSMTANGQGNFDRYIIGDGRTAATALELKYLDDSARPYIVEEVNKAVADIQPIEITGDVTNAPDEEDLTSENQGGTDVLKFKDKAYNSALYSGLGRTYLRKNIVTLDGMGKNVLTQAMVNTANTIYHIQYDYDLNGQTITLPAGCVLEFDGGSLSNGCLSGTFNIVSDNVCMYGITFSSATIESINLGWFNIQENIPCTDILKNFFKIVSNEVIIPKYKFPLLVEVPSSLDEDGMYSCIQITNNSAFIDFKGNTIKLVANNYERYVIIHIVASNSTFKNARIIGDVSEHTGSSGEQGHGLRLSRCHDVVIENCEIDECWGDGINLVDISISDVDYYPYNIFIRNTRCYKNRRQGISIEAGRNILVEDCEFAYTGEIASTLPTSGVDIEPWHDVERAKVDIVTFKNCSIHDNVGLREIMLSKDPAYSTAAISNISIVGCSIYNNTGTYKTLLESSAAKNINISSCVIGTDFKNGLVAIKSASSTKILDSSIFGQLYVTYCDTDLEIGNTNVFKNDVATASGYSSVKRALEVWHCSDAKVYNSKFSSTVYSCFYFHNSTIDFKACEFLDNNDLTDSADRNFIHKSIVLMDSCRLSLGSSIQFSASSSENHHFSIANSSWEKKNIGWAYFFIVSLNSHIEAYDYDIEIIATELINPKGAVFTRIAASDAVKIYIEKFPDIAIIPTYNDYRLLPTNDNNGDYPIKHCGTTAMRGYVSNHLTAFMVGFCFFDTTLNKPLYWTGTSWVDATGAAAQ